MELLSDAMGGREFMTYLEKEFSGEKQWQQCWILLAKHGMHGEKAVARHFQMKHASDSELSLIHVGTDFYSEKEKMLLAITFN